MQKRYNNQQIRQAKKNHIDQQLQEASKAAQYNDTKTVWNIIAKFTKYRKKDISTLKHPNGLPCTTESQEADVIAQYMTNTLKCTLAPHVTPVPPCVNSN
jgi:chorismate mutase